MKKNWWCSIVLAMVLLGLSFVISLVREQVFAQQSIPGLGPQVLIRQPPEPLRCFVDITLMDDPANPARKVQILTIVDPESKHILVYQADMGKVTLLSSRNFQPDLMFEQYNAEYPTPIEIRKELQRELQRLKNQTQ